MAVLLATAPSLDDIRESIGRFYCGTSTTLVPVADHAWKIVRTSDGKTLDDVRVIRKRGRYRFEGTTP